MVSTLRDNAPSYSVVKKWADDFRRGRESLEDDPRQGRPATVTTQEIIDKIHDMSLTDRRLIKRFIATELGISQERAHALIQHHLKMTKASARWVPKLLGRDQNNQRTILSFFILIHKDSSGDL
ncbi:protein GVQW3-like [Oratosquilla oratoria]|uniref:protein GVQW3-like n=1 Tax=Oratosquilla oratoria TaxID=337810 RepID=UPI003F768B5B